MQRIAAEGDANDERAKKAADICNKIRVSLGRVVRYIDYTEKVTANLYADFDSLYRIVCIKFLNEYDFTSKNIDNQSGSASIFNFENQLKNAI